MTRPLAPPYRAGMDLQLTPQHLKFRDELRAWLKANIARPWREELRDPKHTEETLKGLWCEEGDLNPYGLSATRPST